MKKLGVSAFDNQGFILTKWYVKVYLTEEEKRIQEVLY